MYATWWTTLLETRSEQACAGVEYPPSSLPPLRHRDRYLVRIHSRGAQNLR